MSLPQAVTRGDLHTGPTRSPARTGPEVSGVAGWPPNLFALGHKAQARRGNTDSEAKSLWFRRHEQTPQAQPEHPLPQAPVHRAATD